MLSIYLNRNQFELRSAKPEEFRSTLPEQAWGDFYRERHTTKQGNYKLAIA